jgi:hypothetical protein
MTERMRGLLAMQPWSSTALHRAILCRNEVALQTMVDAGANHSFANPEGVTPLQYAVLYGSEAMVQALLPHGALERTVLENDMRAGFDLVTLAVQHYIRSDYCPVWVCDFLFRQRAANVDLILSGTRGHWAPADLEGWLEYAEEPFVREVLEVVHSHLRFTDLRRAWILVVVCSGWRCR